MKDWKEYKLNDICTVVSSKRIFAEQYVNEGIPFYRQKEIIELHSKQPISEPLYISNEVFSEMKKKTGVPKKGDILLTAVGVTLGIPFLVNNEEFYFKDGNLIWLKNFSENIDSSFLYYWLDSKSGWESIYMRAIGSAQPALTIDLVKKYKMLFPSLPTQQKIASILSAYDNLIQNYKKQIEALQTAASELYKEWFVRFRFPGWKTTKFENGIPEGWDYIQLKDIVKFDRGISYSSEEIDCDYGVNLINLKNIEAYGGFRRDGTKKYNGKYKPEQMVKCGDLVMGITDMTQDRRTVGSVALIPNIEGICVISADLLKVTTKISKIFFYSLCRFGQYSRYFSMFANGANVLHLRPDSLLRKKILLPTNELITKFDSIVSSIINKMDKLNLAIDNLTQQRDLLLPRLMSGKLEVE